MMVLKDHKKVSLLVAKELLLEAYEIDFKLFDHVKQSQIEKNSKIADLHKPLSLVAMHPTELNSGPGTRFNQLAAEFMELKIGELFRIDFLDFLDLPVEKSVELRELAKIRYKAETKIHEDAIENMYSSQKNKK